MSIVTLTKVTNSNKGGKGNNNGGGLVDMNNINNSNNNNVNSSGSGVENKETTSSVGGGRALKLQADSPHLVNLGGNRFSTAVTVHPIPPGRISLGSNRGVDVHVQGTGVEPLHCEIENDNGVVTLYPVSEYLAIDGIRVTKPTRLTQGAMLTIGRSNYLRFNHPEEANLIKSVLPNARISMTPIKFDVDVPVEDLDIKYDKKPPSIPRKIHHQAAHMPDQPLSSIQMKVSKFEYLAAQNLKKSISPKVFSSNLVTVNTPAKDVLGRAPPDLQDLAKNLPQSALNYSDSCFYDDKQKNKTPDRQFFGRKSPHQYVNVAINESKTINNRVVLFDNGKKEINTSNKQINVEINANNNNSNTLPIVRHRSVTPSPNNNNVKQMHRRSGSLGELFEDNNSNNNNNNNCGNIPYNSASFYDVPYSKNEAEIKRNKAQIDRIKEQEIERAEQARLEEILTMCAEYEKQVQWEKNNKVSTPNRIKTNGSLPRDKRQCMTTPQSSYGIPSPTSSPLTPSSSKSNDSRVFKFDDETNFYENNVNRLHYENVQILRDNRANDCGSMYENVFVTQQQNNLQQPYPHSPRTRIKTIPPGSSKDKDTCSRDQNMDIIDNKFTSCMENGGRHCFEKKNDAIVDNMCELQNIKPLLPNKIIMPLVSEQKIESLQKEKQKTMDGIVIIRRKMAEIEMQQEEVNRELEIERALINGEHDSKILELKELRNRKEFLTMRAKELEAKMEDCQKSQTTHQENCKIKLLKAQEVFNEIERKLSEIKKQTTEYDRIFEKYLEAQEILDNERKTFEDLEFHQLEEEANWLAGREEIQREVVELSQRIDAVQDQIFDLEKQQEDTSRCSYHESKTLERQKVNLSGTLEENRSKLAEIEKQLSLMKKNQDSDQEFSSGSDSEESPSIIVNMQNMSISMIETNPIRKNYENEYNMSQSFNEKMLLEKQILDVGITKQKYPSQDDIDRISKVTLDAPMNIEEGRGSLGKKTIESLKEIERNRQLHLVQQGSQVIEQERKRVLALKQRVQEEVRTQWAQRSKQNSPFTSSNILDGDRDSSISNNEDYSKENGSIITKNQKGNDNYSIDHFKTKSASEVIDSPTRPLSESSDFSVDTGTLSKGRRQVPDKARPLTRYLPIRSSELDLRQHIESAGHQVVLCPHVFINSFSCRGFLHKRGSKLNNWSRRWFVFDRNRHTLTYYLDKSEKKPRGGAYFQAIEEVYLDHSNSVKSPNPQLTFIVKTHERCYFLMAPSPEAMRIWIDVIFTGAEGYQEFEHGT